MIIKKKAALLASLLAAATISLGAVSADARRGGGHGGGHGGGGWGGGHSHGAHWGGMGVRSHAFSGGPRAAFRHHHHHRHARVFAFAPYYYDYGYSYGDGCYWLKRRALYTGSRYWWNRYYSCIDGY